MSTDRPPSLALREKNIHLKQDARHTWSILSKMSTDRLVSLALREETNILNKIQWVKSVHNVH